MGPQLPPSSLERLTACVCVCVLCVYVMCVCPVCVMCVCVLCVSCVYVCVSCVCRVCDVCVCVHPTQREGSGPLRVLGGPLYLVMPSAFLHLNPTSSGNICCRRVT